VRTFSTISEVRADIFLSIIKDAEKEINEFNQGKFYMFAEQMKARFFVIELMLSKIEKLLSSNKEDKGVKKILSRAKKIVAKLDKIVPACGRFN